MRGLLRAEMLKITSTRLALGMLAGAAGYVMINIVALVFAAGQQGVPALTVASSVRNVYAAAGAASPIVLVAGILGMTTEYRFMTITSTFLVTPRRSRVLSAKLVVHAGLGLVMGVVCSVTTVVLATGLLRLKPHAPLAAGTIVQICGGADAEFTDEARRDALLATKTATLERKLAALLPSIDPTAAFRWTGSFGQSTTGLPSIGAVPGYRHCYAVMGYGGNGITFSMLAAELIAKAIGGREDPDASLFAFR